MAAAEINHNHLSARRLALRWTCQFVGYVGEESPVEGAGFEEEKSSCSKRAILALLSFSCSVSILSCFVLCSIS